MPMTAAHARKLLHQGKARLVPHHALTVVQLEPVLPEPVLRPIVAGVAIHFNTAEIFLLAEGPRKTFPLLRLVVDLRTDLPWRIRRRAMYRRRRRFRGRYRAPRRHGRPFRRPGPVPSRHRRPTRTSTASPTIQWRAQAIQRVISALQRFVPISHVVVLEPSTPERHRSPSLSPSERRHQLIAAYGTPDAAGQRHAQCAYCGTTRGPIVVDHMVTESRGGTGIWSNLALACKACNDRKRDRTPEEAGMPVRFQPVPEPAPPQRARPYVRQTAHALLHNRTTDRWIGHWLSEVRAGQTRLSRLLQQAIKDVATDPEAWPTLVARPVARPRKQVFTARNYPLDTSLGPGFVQVGQSIKRRVQVNRGLALIQRGTRLVVQVVATGAEPPDDAVQFVTIGMLCRAHRAGRTVVGMVRAVHTDGRLTLHVPVSADADGVTWERVVVSPRRGLRVLSTDGVLFLALEKNRMYA